MLFMDSSGRLVNASRAADNLALEDFKERTKPPPELSLSPGGEIPYQRPGYGRPPGGEHGGPPTRFPGPGGNRPPGGKGIRPGGDG